MRLPLMLILSVGCLFAAVTGEGAPAPPQDRDKIQGTWTSIGGEERGTPCTEKDAVKEEFVFIFRGDGVTTKKHGKTQGTGTFALDQEKNPKAIDFILDGDKDKKTHAIYSLDGDTLKICVIGKFRPNRSDQRPKLFTTKRDVEGHGDFLIVLKREKH